MVYIDGEITVLIDEVGGSLGLLVRQHIQYW